MQWCGQGSFGHDITSAARLLLLVLVIGRSKNCEMKRTSTSVGPTRGADSSCLFAANCVHPGCATAISPAFQGSLLLFHPRPSLCLREISQPGTSCDLRPSMLLLLRRCAFHKSQSLPDWIPVGVRSDLQRCGGNLHCKRRSCNAICVRLCTAMLQANQIGRPDVHICCATGLLP